MAHGMCTAVIVSLKRSGSTALLNTLCQDNPGWNHPFRSAFKAGQHPKVAQAFYQKEQHGFITKETMGYERSYTDYLDALILPKKTACIFLFRHPLALYRSWKTDLQRETHIKAGIHDFIHAYKTLIRLVKQTPKPIVVIFEQLVKQPKPILQTLCQKLSIPFVPSMLNWRYSYKNNPNITYHDPSQVGRNQPKHAEVNNSKGLHTVSSAKVKVSAEEAAMISTQLMPMYQAITQQHRTKV
jgi:hypothetical protein